jgi:hypothetical protein
MDTGIYTDSLMDTGTYTDSLTSKFK